MKKRVLDYFNDVNIKCYQSNRFCLDVVHLDSYQDLDEQYMPNKIWEKGNKNKTFININSDIKFDLFKYFLDGSRYTYKVGEMITSSGKYMPIIAGQVAAGISMRENGKMKKYSLLRKNLVVIYNLINDLDYEEIKCKIEAININNVKFIVERYKGNESVDRPENLAIAKIQSIMMELELKMISDIVKSGQLASDEMLVVDGSLQFMNKGENNEFDERMFKNVIGISKSFNPNLRGLFKDKTTEVASILTKLKFGQRTPVYKLDVANCDKIIGAWYMRIRPEEKVRNPLDGVIKIEKVAVTEDEKMNGFDSFIIDNISKALMEERNVTCYGSDARWCNHIYPMYLTEKMLKESFISAEYFMSLF